MCVADSPHSMTAMCGRHTCVKTDNAVAWYAGAIKAAGDCPADVSNDCPSGNFGYNNRGGCGNVGCSNVGTGNTGNNNTGTANKGDNNNGSNNVGRCLNGSGLTGDNC